MHPVEQMKFCYINQYDLGPALAEPRRPHNEEPAEIVMAAR